jgi:outer membrane immunogenic protein
MKRLLLAGGAGVLLGMGGALAADLPTKAPMQAPVVEAPPSWSGIYLGAMVSERVTYVDWTTTGMGGGRVVDANSANARFGNAAVRGGGFLGFNRQMGNMVIGLEGDGAGGNNADSHSGIPGAPPLPNSDPAVTDPTRDATRLRLGWDASIRARFGYLVLPTVMVYGTAGGAFQNIQSSVSCTQLPPAQNPAPAGTPIGGAFCGTSRREAFSLTRAGWTAGAGLEALLSNSWTGRLEYRFADYGSFNHVYFANTPDQIASRISVFTHTVSIGLAFKFGGAP